MHGGGHGNIEFMEDGEGELEEMRGRRRDRERGGGAQDLPRSDLSF